MCCYMIESYPTSMVMDWNYDHHIMSVLHKRIFVEVEDVKINAIILLHWKLVCDIAANACP